MKIHLLLTYIVAFFLVVACGTTKGTTKTSDAGDNNTTAQTGGKDDDYDGVPNVEDDCPFIYGSARTGGCPDSDGDGLRDSEDACPDDKGFANLKGCQDRDSDGVIDPEDNCPDEYGDNLVGCPAHIGGGDDIDGDGVKNDIDECPDLAGWFTANGCPDRDGDGIKDDIDECADMFGSAEYNGCPLNRSDVIRMLNQYGDPAQIAGVAKQGYYRAIDGKLYDRNNKLISVVGGEIVGQDGSIMTETGDYFVDSEGSIRNTNGKLVKLDEDNYLFIPNVGVLNTTPINGFKKGGIDIGNQNGLNIGNGSNGTFNPNDNGDGTNNTYDGGNPYNSNNEVSGTNDNIYDNPPQNYKPLSPSEASDCNRIDLASLRAAIYFDYDASRAESTSLQQLNRVVDAMRKCAALELQVGGHADSDGGNGYNTKLSEKRAKSVLKYIKGQGISDTRLKYNAYGEKYPIANNNTEDGKQKNRRAEIHVSRAQ